MITAALCLLWPWVAKRWAERSKVAGAIGAVVLCYAPGILLVNLANPLADAGVAEAFSEATIPLAIPLMLFSTRLAGWFEHGRSAALSFGLAAASVVGAALALGLIAYAPASNITFLPRFTADTYAFLPLFWLVFAGACAIVTEDGPLSPNLGWRP